MKKYTCPCCGYQSLDSDGDYDICEICFWEDDPYQKLNANELGANSISLIEAQENFMVYGACNKESLQHVREPSVQDVKDFNWKPIISHE
ncbi:CPCC family cysteine-rich protein [Priestia megaterium]|uniref:CPCC family cysteine-rich protein n=1 Tax=Priestia megaterium TaxID=1404 RepID=UPI00101C95ED|nr:CPCC family cysteine-rich protein [Priestia megaterium]